MSASLNMNSISISEFQGSSGQLLTTENEFKNVSVTENTSEMNTHNFDNFQYNHEFVQVLPPTNENNIHHQAAVHSGYYYHTTHVPVRRQQNNLTDKQGVNSDVIFAGNQETQAQLFPEASGYFPSYDTNSHQQIQTDISTQQQFSVNEYPTTTLTPILNSTSTYVTSTDSLECDSTSTMINPNTTLSIDAVRVESNNSNLTFDNNYTATEYRASSNTTLPSLDNPELQAINFTSNQLLEQQYHQNMQTEAINSVLAHQWHQRREKLPATLDATFYTEWQINRPKVVNTAEIQKRKLQLLGGTLEKQLGRVDQHNKNYSASKRTKQQQQQQQPHHLYRLHQMQQQNHLRSPTPDSLSSSRQLANSPLNSLDSSTASGPQFQQQKLPDTHVELPSLQIQAQEACTTLPIYDNSMYGVSAQQIVLQALQQQQYFQQLLILQHLNQTTVCSDSLEKQQEVNQQRHHEALQENTSRHKSSTCKSGQLPKKRKRQRSPAVVAQKIVDDKENASENSSERALVIDESAVSPSNVQLDDSKRDDESESKLAGFEQRIAESVIVNLDDVAALSSSGQKSVKCNQRSKDKSKISSESSPAGEPSGMWLNNYTMFRDWITSQQSIVDQHQSEIIQ